MPGSDRTPLVVSFIGAVFEVYGHRLTAEDLRGAVFVMWRTREQVFGWLEADNGARRYEPFRTNHEAFVAAARIVLCAIEAAERDNRVFWVADAGMNVRPWGVLNAILAARGLPQFEGARPAPPGVEGGPFPVLFEPGEIYRIVQERSLPYRVVWTVPLD